MHSNKYSTYVKMVKVKLQHDLDILTYNFDKIFLPTLKLVSTDSKIAFRYNYVFMVLGNAMYRWGNDL